MGAKIVQQGLKAGLLDELTISLIPCTHKMRADRAAAHRLLGATPPMSGSSIGLGCLT